MDPFLYERQHIISAGRSERTSLISRPISPWQIAAWRRLIRCWSTSTAPFNDACTIVYLASHRGW